LIARNFAEGGVTDLFKQMLKLVCQYQNAKDIMAVSGSFVEIDPREWTNQFNLNINIGLGTNNKDQQAQHLMGLMQIQEKALQIGVCTPENIYNAASLYAVALGQKSPDKFFTDPSTQPPPPPQPPPPDPALLKIQADQQLQQNQLQADVHKYQAEQVVRERELQLEAERDRSKIQLEAQKAMQQAQLDMQERQHEAQLEAQLAQQRLEFDKWKAQLENDTKVIVAQIMAAKTAEAPGVV
jgi:type IV secretory pathway VirB10-like protein